MFTLLKSLALSPLAGVDGSARLGVVLNEMPAGRRDGLSYPDYQYLRDHDRAFAGLAGSVLTAVHVGTRQPNAAGHGRARHRQLLSGARRRARSSAARCLPSDEVAPGQHPVVVLSDGLWRRAFAADPDIVGKTIT